MVYITDHDAAINCVLNCKLTKHFIHAGLPEAKSEESFEISYFLYVVYESYILITIILNCVLAHSPASIRKGLKHT